MNHSSIFLVEDDANFGSVLKSYLEMNDFVVCWVQDGNDAFAEFKEGQYDLCVLDIMLPNKDGFSIAREIKTQDPSMPLIFLTAKTLKQDVLRGYEMGADDYVTKPFDSDVLLCKIRAILNRKKSETFALNEIKVGAYRFHTDRRILKIGDHQRKLSPKEGELLKLFLEHINQVLDRDKALNSIWGQDDYFTARSMDVYITRLRKYLKQDPSIAIENVHGSGYILRVEK